MVRRSGNRRALARKAFAALTLTVLFVAMALGGRSYLYCRAMGEIMTTASICACATIHTESTGQASFEANPDCLERRSLDKLVSFTTAASYVVQAAPLLATLPATWPLSAQSLAPAERAEHPIRAGPHGPTSSRAKLMVFLT
jgi:hypothetical protein